MSSIRDLRYMAEGLPASSRQMSLQETARMFILDEAYLGRKPVDKIQKAMDKLYAKVMAFPNIDINREPEGKALEQAFCDVFGFQSCHIYWSNRPGLGVGPCTLPSSRIMSPEASDVKYGTNSKGFYDKRHLMHVFIETDQILFTEGQITSEEMVAILLHEVGHNFDFSPWSVIDVWYSIIDDLLNILLSPSPDNLGTLIGHLLVQGPILSTPGRAIYTSIMHFDQLIANRLPPVKFLLNLTNRAGVAVNKILELILFTPLGLLQLAKNIVMTPFLWMKNIVLRKKETYADSFAASYGYGAELTTGLDKMNLYMANGPFEFGPVTDCFYDLCLARTELIQTIYGGHGSTAQRSLRMLDKLDEDMNDRNIDAATRAIIKKERDRVQQAYNSYVNTEQDQQKAISRLFRGMMDDWYGGKSYLLMPQVDKNFAR